MDGHEATRIIRTQPPFSTDARIRTIPIISLVASKFGDPATYIRQGYEGILIKPLRFPGVKAMLLKWSRWQPPLEGVTMVPAWGPYPLRMYRGPRSRLWSLQQSANIRHYNPLVKGKIASIRNGRNGVYRMTGASVASWSLETPLASLTKRHLNL
jgi:CheY-like chemotaxis protein